MNWVKQFRTKGLEGLKDQPGRGTKPFLPAYQHSAFRQAVLELQENKKGGCIRGSDILELMKTKYGVEPSLRRVYGTLKRAGLVWITGRSIHPKADLEIEEAFKKTSEIK